MRLLAAVLLLAASAVRAQAPDTLVATVGRDGLNLRAGDASVSIGALVQADARFFASEGDLGTDEFLLRRARFFIRGRLGPVTFRVIPELGQGRAGLDEGWAQVTFSEALAARAGFQKVPIGMERLHSSSSLMFAERALPTGLTPDIDVGLVLLGDLGASVEYSVGVMNGALDGQSAVGDLTDSKDVVGRVLAHPFSGPLEGLTLGVGGSYGRESGTAGAPGLSRYRTSGGRQIAGYITGDSAAVASGARTRLVPQASFYLGPASAMAEWAISSQRVARGAEERAIAVHAWQLAVGAVLTGEDATAGRLRPARPLGQGGMGAFEVTARVHGLTVDEDAFPVFMDPATSSRSATAFALGAHWYLTDYARFSVTGERTTLGAADGFEDPPAENVLFGRLQMSI